MPECPLVIHQDLRPRLLLLLLRLLSGLVKRLLIPLNLGAEPAGDLVPGQTISKRKEELSDLFFLKL